MLHCCTYNVNTNMADVLLHVKLRRGRCAAAATKLGRLYVLTQRMTTLATVRMYRTVSLTGATNKDLVW